MAIHCRRRAAALLPLFTLLVTLLPLHPPTALASHTPPPTSVTIAGALQSELGCSADWQPDCAATQLALGADDGVWNATWTLPAGTYEFKAALNNSWDENYGRNAAFNGDNIALTSTGAPITFLYDHATHWVASSGNAVIATVPGSFQSELGCPNDWTPDCLRSWLQDADGDGVYTFSTTAIPAGAYESKVAINQGWDENYGQDGVSSGANIGFTVPAAGSTVVFTYVAATHVLSITVTPPAATGTDNNVQWDGLRHDSRDTLYRTPGGAVAAGTPVTIRFRTIHADVTAVNLRLYDVNANGQRIVPMQVAAADVPCAQAGLEAKRCDFWAATIDEDTPNNLWYRFVVADGADVDYYADNTAALDGGLGVTTDDAVDQSFALMFYGAQFMAPAWARDAIVYQIFPDRFRNGRSDNDARTGDVRYDDPALRLPWNTLPEGYCRNYADATPVSCAWRFGTPPAWGVGQKETPRGRDYMGGDLKGVDQQLDYLKALGINTLYFNPIFDAGSNHGYDTQNYYALDPYFGTQKDWDNLNKHADQLGIRIILDGVFNHMSSDSPIFDRYHHYSTVGACESASSPYRAWFNFRAEANGPCAGPSGPNTMNYDGWFGFDSIPVLNKSLPEVQQYFISGGDSVTKHWLKAGAEGWRLDVMGDASFPDGYWEQFRAAVKTTDANALIVGELWQKDSTLLRYLRGDRADSTMNYRMRDAIIGLLAPGTFDSKGFGDSGRVIAPSEFAARLQSIREDYADATYFSLMNLLDSHDTERLRWTLTPGAETQAAREQNAANVADGKQRVRLASLIQFTMAGMPTVYYGDEVGLTGDDDPDDRRTYPWTDKGGSPDTALLAHYQKLAQMRTGNPALTAGNFAVLMTDDAAGAVAYGRKTGAQAAIVALNRSAERRTLTIPVGGFVPNGTRFDALYGVGTPTSNVTAGDGNITVTLAPMSAVLLATAKNVDLTPPPAPTNVRVTAENDESIGLAWNPVPGAAAYNVYRSFVDGGYTRVNQQPLTATSFIDDDLRNASLYFYVVKALDAAGNESTASSTASGMPHLAIGWANLQWPPTLTHTVSAVDRTEPIYGQVWIDGVTAAEGAAPTLRAQVGYGSTGSKPSSASWTWVDAAFNADVGNNDEFMAALQPEAVGSYDYVYRYTTTDGRDWLYANLNGPLAAGATPPNPGKLTVVASGDTTAPAVPTGLRVVSASPDGVSLAWDAVGNDPTLYGYEVLRRTGGAAFTQLARVTTPAYTDTAVVSDATYEYMVRTVDTSFNRSGDSAPVSATAALRSVTLVVNLTVPATTDGTGRQVTIAGFLDRLDGGLPQWDPTGVTLTRVDATHWTISFTGSEATQIEYKYALASWDFVEKDTGCGEVANRSLTLTYGANGTQTINDVVTNWRNVAPCGN